MKIRSYSSGNQCFFWKMSENVEILSYLFPELVFYFDFFLNYFWTANKLIKFLVGYRAYFFDFWPYIAGKSNFWYHRLSKIKNLEILSYLFPELVFYFDFFLNYFWTANKLIKFLVDYRAHFFDFGHYMAGKTTFWC